MAFSMRLIPLLIILFHFNFLLSQGLHTPSELIKILESSNIKYNLDIIELKVDPINRADLVCDNIFFRLDSSESLVTRIYPYELGANNEVKELFSLAQDLINNEESVKARNLCIKILGLAPDYYRVMTLIGETYLLDGNLDKAQEII